MSYVIRSVESLSELQQAFTVTHAQFPPRTDPERQRLYDIVARRFPVDQQLMLVVADEFGRLVGGALAVRKADSPSDSPAESTVELRALALEPEHRGTGLGRQLLERIESTAAELGATSIGLGSMVEARGFYRRLGYAGRSRMWKPLPGKGISRYGDADERQRRLRELRERRLRRMPA